MIAAKSSPSDGPLPFLLHLLTIVTGFVDAVSFLRYEHVFVANMTGNVVLLGFAIAGAPGISIVGSFVALGAFLLGGLLGGKLGASYGSHRGDLFALATAIKAPLLVFAALLSLFAPENENVIVAVLGITMGIQVRSGLVTRRRLQSPLRATDYGRTHDVRGRISRRLGYAPCQRSHSALHCGSHRDGHGHLRVRSRTRTRSSELGTRSPVTAATAAASGPMIGNNYVDFRNIIR